MHTIQLAEFYPLMKRSSLAAVSFAVFLLVLTLNSTLGQQIDIARQGGPYYVGEPAVVQVIAAGVVDAGKAECRYVGELPDGVTIDGPRVSQSSRSFYQNINGRVSSSESIDYRFSFLVTSEREGVVDLGEFEVDVDGKTQRLNGYTFEFEPLEQDEDMELALVIDPDFKKDPDSKKSGLRRFYLGQRVPIEIEWAFAGEGEALQYAYGELQIRSQLFDTFPVLSSTAETRNSLKLKTVNGLKELPATVATESRGGKKFVVVTAKCDLLVDQLGSFEKISSSCRTQRVTQWSRALFGGMSPAKSKPSIALSDPVSFEVVALPEQGRPSSFSGAVGEGFEISVSANRTVVRTGDPITLDIQLRGDVDIDSLSLPDLSVAGLDSGKFRLPGEVPPARINAGAKQYKVQVRVADEGVEQIPALEFAWFDPKSERYKTTRSDPIALEVLPTQIVGANDVVAANAAADDSNSQDFDSTDSSTNSASDENNPLSKTALTGLASTDLSIEKRIDKLFVSRSLLSAPWLSMLIYALCVTLAMIAITTKFVVGRVAKSSATAPGGNSDPGKRRTKVSKRRSVDTKATIRQLEAAAKLPWRQSAATIAVLLREAVSEMDGERRLELEQLIAECEAIQYAPEHLSEQDRINVLTTRAIETLQSTEQS